MTQITRGWVVSRVGFTSGVHSIGRVTKVGSNGILTVCFLNGITLRLHRDLWTDVSWDYGAYGTTDGYRVGCIVYNTTDGRIGCVMSTSGPSISVRFFGSAFIIPVPREDLKVYVNPPPEYRPPSATEYDPDRHDFRHGCVIRRKNAPMSADTVGVVTDIREVHALTDDLRVVPRVHLRVCNYAGTPSDMLATDAARIPYVPHYLPEGTCVCRGQKVGTVNSERRVVWAGGTGNVTYLPTYDLKLFAHAVALRTHEVSILSARTTVPALDVREGEEE